MKRLKTKKSLISKNNFILIIILLIVLFTYILGQIIGRKVSNNMTKITREVITDVITNIVNANIKGEIFQKYKINDLILLNTNNGKVESIDYNLENAYNLLIDIKKSIMKNVSEMKELDYFTVRFDNSKIYLKVPIYNYTNNLLLANIGPKIESRIQILQSISGNMKTKIKTYGINSLQVELYINFTVESSFIIPFEEKVLVNSYDVLVASKVIQGEVPSLYNGLFEQNSNLIKVNE